MDECEKRVYSRDKDREVRTGPANRWNKTKIAGTEIEDKDNVVKHGMKRSNSFEQRSIYISCLSQFPFTVPEKTCDRA